MKFRPMRAKLFHADGQTNITKLIVAIRNFANAPKNARTDKKFEEWGFEALPAVTGNYLGED